MSRVENAKQLARGVAVRLAKHVSPDSEDAGEMSIGSIVILKECTIDDDEKPEWQGYSLELGQDTTLLFFLGQFEDGEWELVDEHD